MSRPRVAVFTPYWDFWESSAGPGLRADVERLERLARAVLDVEWVTPEGAEAFLVLQTMAVPPTAALERVGDLPIVIWAADAHDSLPDSFAHGDITRHGATVGVPMLTSVLVREGRPFELAAGRITDPEVVEAVMAALRGAAASHRLPRSRVGRIGLPQPGYLGVDSPNERIERLLGIEVVALDPQVFVAAYDDVSPNDVDALADEVTETFDIVADMKSPGFRRSLQASCALERIVADHRLDAGTLNCHVPEIRFGDIGIAPCFALGQSTTRGIPWTCTGDILTAVAMLVSKSLGRAAQYHELEARDHGSGEFVIASSGEHDLHFASAARPTLQKNHWFASDPCPGACACFSAPAGPASLLALADLIDGYRLIVGTGHLTGRSFPGVGTANGAFRFDNGPDAWLGWCRAGANHHSSATTGNIAREVAACARFMRLDHIAV